MLNFIITLLSVGVLLGILILVHEFGHFATAKLFGVRVEVFSIGFGKRLVGFTRGDTDYRLSALPLGGYVKMSGENPMEFKGTADPREFMSRPRWQRLLIAISGPTMNIGLAIALLTGVFMLHFSYPAFLNEPAVIGWVADKSPAATAGILPGDRIVMLDGMANPTWEDVLPKIGMNAGQPLDLTIRRGNESIHKTLTPDGSPDQLGDAGWKEDQPNVITDLNPGMPAAQAGMGEGDVITAIDGKPLRSLPAIIQYLQATRGKTVDVTATRDGHDMHFALTPVLTDAEGSGDKHYRIGFGSQPMRVTRLPFAAAFAKSLQENRRSSLLIVELVKKMVQRKISVKQMDGPIGIARASGAAVRQKGWIPFIELMAAISLNLGVFNLFPIPILDGGMILMLLIEGVIRRDISLRIKERIYQAAFVFLVLFATLVIYNDIAKAWPAWARLLS